MAATKTCRQENLSPFEYRLVLARPNLVPSTPRGLGTPGTVPGGIITPVRLDKVDGTKFKRPKLAKWSTLHISLANILRCQPNSSRQSYRLSSRKAPGERAHEKHSRDTAHHVSHGAVEVGQSRRCPDGENTTAHLSSVTNGKPA